MIRELVLNVPVLENMKPYPVLSLSCFSTTGTQEVKGLWTEVPGTRVGSTGKTSGSLHVTGRFLLIFVGSGTVGALMVGSVAGFLTVPPPQALCEPQKSLSIKFQGNGL